MNYPDYLAFDPVFQCVTVPENKQGEFDWNYVKNFYSLVAT